VGAGDEGAAHLGAVPAGDDTETQRLLGFDVTCGKYLHGDSLIVSVGIIAERSEWLGVG